MTAPTLTVVERDDITPLCQHCGHQLNEIYAKWRGLPVFQGRTLIFFCPVCHKVLGMGQERAA